MSRIYADEGQSGYFSATFDDVCIDQEIPYDDFENVILLDDSKWDVNFNFQWWYVQHRKKGDGSDYNRICFGLFYNDSINITDDVVDTVELFDPAGDSISLGEIKFLTEGENSLYGGYNGNTSQWYYGDWGENIDHYYSINFGSLLQTGTYHMRVTLNDVQEINLYKDFEGLKDLPVISSDSFYMRKDSEDNTIWTWDVPDGISQDWQTSARAFVFMYDENEYIGDLTVKVPAHMGYVFIPADVLLKLEERVNTLDCDTVKLCVQLRTNDNCNRTYSNEITLEEAENPPIHCDINGDGKTGLAEAIHALQVVSGSR